jgi:hypothetical protein
MILRKRSRDLLLNKKYGRRKWRGIMKSRFLVKAYFVALLMLAVIFFLIACSQSEGANWKQYFQDDDTNYFYDKDSIHYPMTKKKILGLTVRNKEIVNVWTRWTSKKDVNNSYTYLLQIYCEERECKGCDFIDPRAKGGVEGYEKVPIKPSSEAESLLKKVCP